MSLRGAIATKQSQSKGEIASLPLVARNDASFVPCADFNLAATLNSGQVFRWVERAPGSFSGWIGPRFSTISQQDSCLHFSGCAAEAVRHFFTLDLNLLAIIRQIDQDEMIHRALRAHRGLRLIRQDPWECLASFILSSFNNIPRLTGMLERLCHRFGERGAFGSSDRFPSGAALAKVPERVLRELGLGFRAPLLKAAATRVARGEVDLEKLRGVEDEALRRALLEIPGVGEKVAECVMLFAYQRYGAFPVDVWIGRAMRGWYFKGRKVTDRQIRAFARKHFGPHCGWAQQYLYYAARSRTSFWPVGVRGLDPMPVKPNARRVIN